MRDAAALNAFRWSPNALDSANIIQMAAEQAYLTRQKQKKSVAPDEAEPEAEPEDSTSPDVNLGPAHKRSRLDPPATPLTMPSTSRARSVQQNSANRVQVPRNGTQNNPAFSVPSSRAFHFSNTFPSFYQPDQ
jgi:hypothetical protein